MTRFLPFGSRSKTIQVNTLGGGGSPIPRDWLVAEYLLATNSNDTSGNGYNGTVNGTVTFNGTDATFGAGWVSNAVQITADGTHSIWFKTSDASTRMALISKAAWGNAQRIYVGDANKLQVVIGWPYTELIGGVAVNDGVYHNALYTWGTGGIKLYIDNVLIASNAATHYNNGGTIMNIGYNEAEWPFIWQLKKARIYNRVLNAGEIAALYAEG